MASYTYACKDYPGMDSCPGTFESQAQDELWKHFELHAAAAPQEDPSSWPPDEITTVKALIKKSD